MTRSRAPRDEGVPDQGIERTCPLCSDADVRHVETVSVDALRCLYEALLGPAVREEFRTSPSALDLLECRACRLRYFTPVLEGSPRLYELLNAFPWYYEESKPEFETVARFVPRSGRVLEIGCGAGHFKRYVPGSSYVGLDTSPAVLRHGLARDVDIRNESIEQHAIRHAGRYDAVVAFQVLEHVSTPRAFVASAARCLVPGGVLALSVPSWDAYLGGARNCTLNLPPHHQTLWSDEALGAVGRVIGADLVALAHEPLRPIHVAEYRRVRIENALDRLRGARGRVVDLGRCARISTWLASILCRLQPLPAPRPGVAGHTVTAVFRKGKRD